MPAPRDKTDAGTVRKSSDRSTLLEDVARSLAITSLDYDPGFVEYCCANCNNRCINPADSLLADAQVCADCRLSYLADR